jgi:hypothetical protein
VIVETKSRPGARAGVLVGLGTAVAGLATVLACAESLAPVSQDPLLIDSAGVSIVVSRHPKSDDLRGWAIDPEPTLVLESRGDVVLHWIRGAVRRSDGTIVLVSESTSELLFFASDGAFVRRVGREGDGPGEFRGAFYLRRTTGDTLVVTDRSTGRISWFDGEGDFIRQQSPDRAGLAARLPGHHVLGLTRWIADDQYLTTTRERGLPAPGSRVRPEIGALLHEGAGAVRFLGPFPGREHFRPDDESMGRWAFFPNQTVIAFGTDPTRVYVANSEPFEIRVFREDGALAHVIRDSIPPQRVTSSDLDWERWELLDWARQSGDPEGLTRLADAMPLPDEKPAFESVVVDPFGYVWVKEYHGYSPEAADYRIYDPEGRRVGRVQLPGRFEIHEIGADYVLGVEWSLDYEETVKLFTLRRP